MVNYQVNRNKRITGRIFPCLAISARKEAISINGGNAGENRTVQPDVPA